MGIDLFRDLLNENGRRDKRYIGFAFGQWV